MRMNTGPDGISLIKHFEGLKLYAYPDPVSGDVPWTIGYGCTGPEVVQGCVITNEEAERLLRDRLANEFEPGVSAMLDRAITQKQFDALISLSWNEGVARIRTSTLIRRVNVNQSEAASAEFPKWSFAGGRSVLGLRKRRAAERVIFDGGEFSEALKAAEATK